jgi:hypothetical protein
MRKVVRNSQTLPRVSKRTKKDREKRSRKEGGYEGVGDHRRWPAEGGLDARNGRTDGTSQRHQRVLDQIVDRVLKIGRDAGRRLAAVDAGLERGQLVLERIHGGRREAASKGERLGALLGVELRGKGALRVQAVAQLVGLATQRDW